MGHGWEYGGPGGRGLGGGKLRRGGRETRLGSRDYL